MSALPRALVEADYGWVLALSARHEVETGKLDRARLAELVAASYGATVIGQAGGYLITFDQVAAYDSPNFIWHRERFVRFVYVDRIVTDPRRAALVMRGRCTRIFSRGLEAMGTHSPVAR